MRHAPLLVLGLTLACRDETRPIDATPAHASSVPPLATPATPEIAAERRCGEAGPTPTALPPLLASPLPSLGKATLQPGGSYAVGVVTVRYDVSDGAALVMELAATEADGGPWNLQHPVRPNGSVRLPLGAYRVDARAGAGAPPDRLEIELFREVCPEAAVIDPASFPASLWVSTDGIRMHTSELEAGQLKVSIASVDQRPELEIAGPGYKATLAPRPDAQISVRTGRHRVTVDQIVAGPGTRFADGWSTDGEARAHARVQIEAVQPSPADTRTDAEPARPCGEPSDPRTRLPAEFMAAPIAGGELLLADGKSARLGSIELDVVKPDLHGDDTMRGLNVRLLERRGGPALRPEVLLLGFESAHWTRAGHDLLRIDEDPSRPTLKLRRFTLACPAEHAIQAPPTAPIHLWLSTHGLVSVTIGDARAPALTLGMTTGLASPGLAFHSPRARLFEAIAPDLIGNAYSFDGWLVEVVDVQATGDARREGNDWLTAAPVPPLHVQLRVSPL